LPSATSRRNHAPARVGLAAVAAFVALASLAGCAGPDVQVTVTVVVPSVSSSASTDPADPAAPAAPADPAAPANPGGASVVVTQGPVASECTNSVCHYVHVQWQNLEPGPHVTQCVTDHGDIATWSESTYNYPTADGERDLGCFLGYAGSHVWVVLDGTIESAHANWG